MKTLKLTMAILGITVSGFLLYGSTSSPTTLDYLAAPVKWTIRWPGTSYDYFSFTRTTIKGGRVIEGVDRGGTSLFYLSDTGDVTTFDSTKVGQVENGSYIICSKLSGIPEVYQIKRIYDTHMILFYDSKGKNTPSSVSSTLYPKFE